MTDEYNQRIEAAVSQFEDAKDAAFGILTGDENTDIPVPGFVDQPTLAKRFKQAFAPLAGDLANSTDPTKGAGMVGWKRNLLPSAIQTVAGILSAKPVSVWEFASLVTNRPDPADHETWDWQPAFTAALALHRVIDLSSLTYRIASKVTVPGGKHIISDGALIIKDFAGVGLEFIGGSSFNYVLGNLEVRASAAHTADTSSDSLAPTEHGVHIINNRLIVYGTILGVGHKGSGVKFDSTAPNANRCVLSLRGRNNGVHGVHFSGANDDCAVWQVELFGDGNRKSGVYCDDDFAGRNWQGFIYTENNCKDNAGAGCYIGKLRASELFIYSEEQQASAREIVVGANCSYLDITSVRRNKDDDYSAATQRNRWRIGQKSYTPGYPGGPRNGVAASFHAARARINQPTEYVEIPLLLGNEELAGSLRGWGGSASPSVGIASADGFSRIEVANGEARITIAGTLRLLVGAGFARVPASTVASLPAASTAGVGARAFVTDANSATFRDVVVGGGSNSVPVHSDGTNWRVG